MKQQLCVTIETVHYATLSACLFIQSMRCLTCCKPLAAYRRPRIVCDIQYGTRSVKRGRGKVKGEFITGMGEREGGSTRKTWQLRIYNASVVAM